MSHDLAGLVVHLAPGVLALVNLQQEGFLQGYIETLQNLEVRDHGDQLKIRSTGEPRYTDALDKHLDYFVDIRSVVGELKKQVEALDIEAERSSSKGLALLSPLVTALEVTML